jgi:hypothetical protein
MDDAQSIYLFRVAGSLGWGVTRRPMRCLITHSRGHHVGRAVPPGPPGGWLGYTCPLLSPRRSSSVPPLEAASSADYARRWSAAYTSSSITHVL